MAKKKSLKKTLNTLTSKLKSVQAKDIMSKDINLINENATLAEAAEAMLRARVSGLPVTARNSKVVGIIDSSDLFLLMDMILSGDLLQSDPEQGINPTVKFAMSNNIVKIKKNTNLNKIISIMKNKNIFTLPVYDGKAIVGMVGRRDVYKYFYALIKDLR